MSFLLLNGSLMWGRVAHAEEPPANPQRQKPSADIDGLYLTLGPVGAITRIEDSWFPGAGAEFSLVRIAEREVPAAIGLDFGGIGYAERDGGRLWLELEAAIQRPLPFAVGLSLGVTAEVDPVRVPRWGAQGTLWIFLGVIPYVRGGAVEEAGTYVEAGIMIKIPVKLRY